MSRYPTETASSLLAAAERWKKRCLLDNGSVFGPNTLWTAAHIDELATAFIESPDEGDRSFLEKLKDQMAPSSPRVRQLAAEMLWVMMLIVSKDNTGAATKRQLVKTVWGWSGEDIPDTDDMLGDPLEQGAANTGTAYNTRRWRELAYFIRLSAGVKAMTIEERNRLLSDPWAFGAWADGVEPNENPQFRHVVKFLLFPDHYERICTGHHKREILAAFTGKSMADLRKDSFTSNDKALYSLRQELARKHGTEDLDFYRPPLIAQWRPDEPEPSPGDDSSVRWWKVAPGPNANLWNQCREGGYIAVGWEEPGTAAGLSRAQYMEQQERYRVAHPEYEVDKQAQAWRFAQIPEGDKIVANRGTSEVLGIGTVIGPYYHVSEPYGHRLPVKWESTTPIPVDEQGWRRTLLELDSRLYRDLEKRAGLAESTVEEPRKPEVPEIREPDAPYGIENAIADIFLPMEVIESILEALRSKKNVILQGPPGVGKTYFSTRLAFALMKSESPQRVRMVQFHPSYSYEDFVQGYRPGASGFELREGAFLSFCRRAAADTENKYVFIIDEVNRANLSKVFGELMMLIEPDKRDARWAVPLAYAPSDTSPFHVPSNVYLIGMMNTADRSLAVVDYALRRRFAFFDLEPAIESDAFQEHLAGRGVEPAIVSRIVRRISDLNKRIAKDSTNLGPGFRIGHSYFCGGRLDGTTAEAWYRRVIETEIAPLIREYWFDDPAEAEKSVAILLAPD
jgi:5-methylcytosine-specific restriction protein B